MTERAHNGRPDNTHDRPCHDAPENAQDHADHHDSVCADCGCCWGCATDCCAEYTCPNEDCGCSVKMRWPGCTCGHRPHVHDSESVPELCMICGGSKRCSDAKEAV